MVSCDTCFLTLALVSAFLVVSMDARSWDMAVIIGNEIDFLSRNGVQTAHSKMANVTSLRGLAYDSATGTMFMSTAETKNVSIFSSNLTKKDSDLRPMLKPDTQHSNIWAIVFDPINRTLYWTDTLAKAVMKMEVPLTGNPSSAVKLIDLENQSPYGIALDICNRFIYWTSSNKSVHSIERYNLKSGERKVLVSDNLYDVYAVAVDHSTGKLYWADDEEGLHYKIERSNLDGTEREILLRGTYHQPIYMAVDEEAVYWTDWASKAVWKIKKNKEAKDEPERFKYYEASHDSSEIMSIITRDNIGDIDCAVISKTGKDRLNNTIPLETPLKPSNNLTINKEDVISATQLTKSCLNEGRYDEHTAACTCKKGFTGSLCEVFECHNYCVHGSCEFDAEGSPLCVCNSSYTGSRCETDICADYCLNDGSCFVSAGRPFCQCKNSHGTRCEYTTELDKLCPLYCMATEDVLNSFSMPFCRCSELNETLSERFFAAEPLIPSTVLLSVLIVLIAVLCIVVAVLSYHVNKLRRRPRIRKRFVVSKGGVTPLTSRPQLPADSCEITIENCCNMNICETPCFEPKLRATPTKSSSKKGEEKNSLLDSMEGADSC